MAGGGPEASSGKVLVLVTVLAGISALTMSMYTPSLPAIAAEFEATPAAVQRTLTFFLAGLAGAQLLLGPTSDRFGRKPVLVWGLAAYVASSLLCAFAPSIEMLQFGRFVQGFAACAGPVVARAIIRDLYDGAAAARAFSIVATAIAIVPAAAPILGGFVQQHLGWVWVFYVLTSIGLMLLVSTGARFQESLAQPNPTALSPSRLIGNYGELLGHPVYMANIAAGALIYAGLFAYLTEAPFLFVEELGISPDVFGWLLAITVVAYASGSFLSGRLAGRLEPSTIVHAALAFSLVGVGLLLLLSLELTLVNVIGPMCVYTFGFGLAQPATIARAMQPFPHIAGSASAMMGCLQMAAAGLASFAAAFVHDASASGIGWIALVAILLAGAGYLLLAGGRST